MLQQLLIRSCSTAHETGLYTHRRSRCFAFSSRHMPPPRQQSLPQALRRHRHATALSSAGCIQTCSEAFIQPTVGLAAPVHNQTPKSRRGMPNKQLSSLDERAHGQTRGRCVPWAAGAYHSLSSRLTFLAPTSTVQVQPELPPKL